MSKFVLPTLWHVVTTDENLKDVHEWRLGEKYYGDRGLYVNMIAGICRPGEKGHNSLHSIKSLNGSYDFGVEITTEQFYEHVLGRKPKKQASIKEDTSYLINFLKQNNIT